METNRTRSFANGNADPNQMPVMSEEQKLLMASQVTFWRLV